MRSDCPRVSEIQRSSRALQARATGRPVTHTGQQVLLAYRRRQPHMAARLPSRLLRAGLLQSAGLRCPPCFCHVHRKSVRTVATLSQPSLHHRLGLNKKPKHVRTTGHSACGSARLQTSNHRIQLYFSKSAKHTLPSFTRGAMPTGQSASVVPPSLTSNFQEVISDTEGSDEDESDVVLDAGGLPNNQVDEAITGYLQNGSAGSTRVVKSKAEAHDQVKHIHMCVSQTSTSILSHCRSQKLGSPV